MTDKPALQDPAAMPGALGKESGKTKAPEKALAGPTMTPPRCSSNSSRAHSRPRHARTADEALLTSTGRTTLGAQDAVDIQAPGQLAGDQAEPIAHRPQHIQLTADDVLEFIQPQLAAEAARYPGKHSRALDACLDTLVDARLAGLVDARLTGLADARLFGLVNTRICAVVDAHLVLPSTPLSEASWIPDLAPPSTPASVALSLPDLRPAMTAERTPESILPHGTYRGSLLQLADGRLRCMDANLLSAGCKQHRAIANFFHATQPRRQVRTCRTYHSHLLIAPLLQETQLAESRNNRSPFSASQRAEADCARILALQAEVEQLRQAQTPPTAPSELPVAFAQLRQDLHAQLRGDFSGTFHKPLFPWISADLYADTHPAHDLLHLADAAWTVDAAPEATTGRSLSAALLKFRDHLADLDATFSWDSVSDNTLRVCCARYTVAPAAVWAHLDHELYVPRLSGVLGKAQPTAPPPDPSFSLSKRKQHPAPASSSPKDNVCWNWHSGRCQADPCERKHVCHQCGQSDHSWRRCDAPSKRGTLTN
ncbi:uncharacterized protein PSFLO_06862 [Pseudozyma flocculosa]|uniref:Uncharacterized protein n=1 Tax=Pseudozyma flocculosa TaxID=84751 RepID=A0A5C3FAW4_9BASI|nr:uncharacterized protein PSFLO_06862 [Pseudozyma flocculosa]